MLKRKLISLVRLWFILFCWQKDNFLWEFKHIFTKKTEVLLLSCIKNTDTLNEQIRTKPQVTPKFKSTKPKQTFTFDVLLSLKDEKWILGLTSWEIWMLVFNIMKNIEFNILRVKEKIGNSEEQRYSTKNWWEKFRSTRSECWINKTSCYW